MSPIVTVVEVGRGEGEGVALRRTAGRGHSIIYRGTTDNLTTFVCRLS